VAPRHGRSDGDRLCRYTRCCRQGIEAGKYSLWAKKTGENQWVLAFHPKTGVWGDPPIENGYIAQMPLKLDKAPKSTEQLTINLAEKAGDAAVAIQWGTSELTGTIGVK